MTKGRLVSPPLEPTGEQRYGRDTFRLTRDYIWWLHFKRSGLCLYGPKGFTTDKLSMPLFARLLGCRPDGAGWPAALPHDLGYHGAAVLRVDLDTGRVLESWMPTRAVVDGVFREALPLYGAGPFRARLLYWAVDLFGERAWRRARRVMPVPEFIPLDLLAA